MQEQFALEPAGQTSISILIGIGLLIDLGVGVSILLGGNNGLLILLALLLVLAVSGLFLWIAFAQIRSRLRSLCKS